jgi:hypothetical protein
MRKAPNGKEYESHIARSESGNPLTKFVNLCQSAEERRDKYAFCRFFGVSSYHAIRMRDWHWTKINLFLGNES